LSSDGTLLHGLSAIYVLREMPAVRRFQVHQQADRSVKVQIVPAASFAATDVETIRHGLRRRLGATTPVEISLVKTINSQASGKFRQILSDAVDMGPSRSPDPLVWEAVE